MDLFFGFAVFQAAMHRCFRSPMMWRLAARMRSSSTKSRNLDEIGKVWTQAVEPKENIYIYWITSFGWVGSFTWVNSKKIKFHVFFNSVGWWSREVVDETQLVFLTHPKVLVDLWKDSWHNRFMEVKFVFRMMVYHRCWENDLKDSSFYFFFECLMMYCIFCVL